jgi:DNA-binding NarL/FixJ family response regulator
MMAPMRVLLADDHTLVRAGLRALVESLDGATVVGESGEGREALEIIGKLRPDVVLLDIGMPGMNGLEVARRSAEASPRTRVIILSMHAEETYVRQALRAGVAGYLLKGAAVSELPGETYLTPRVSQSVVQELLRDEPSGPEPLEGLTKRQREILQLIAEGRSTKEIAATLDVSVKTVETHRARLMERLGIRDVAGLTRFALRAGLVE